MLLELSTKSDPYYLTTEGKDRIEVRLLKSGHQWWDRALKVSKPSLCLSWPLFLLARGTILSSLPHLSATFNPISLSGCLILSTCRCGSLHVAAESGLWKLLTNSAGWQPQGKGLLRRMDFRKDFGPACVIYPSLEQSLWPGTLCMLSE